MTESSTQKSDKSGVRFESTNSTEIHSGLRHRVFRNVTEAGAVIVKVQASPSETGAGAVSIRHEYEILNGIDLPGVVRVRGLAPTKEGVALLMADAGDRTLNQHIGSKPLSVTEFLSVAVQLAEIVSRLHAVRIIHRDINPTNVVLDTASHELTLIDFDMATSLPSLTVDLTSPRHLEGSLAYISPEQTGRTGLPVDSRTDLYSLGATLYEAATGAPPFMSSDAVELVHAHIARQPALPHHQNPDLPQALSLIIMKLLEKAPERRYQTAEALAADLREAKAQWQAKGAIVSLPLARHDVPRELILSDQLYGREESLAALENAFACASRGINTFAVVTGPPGIGKSALVRQLTPAVTAAHGLYISGKFDQLQRSEPFSAIAQAFRQLVRQLLAEGDASLADWRVRIDGAVAPNGQLLTDMVPELALIIGPQAAVQVLGPVESKNRFELVLTQFLNCAAQASHPLVMVLDDLQWADVASLQLIEQWATDSTTRHFLMVGAYRDEEVSVSHPLARTLNGLRDAGVAIDDVHLGPLKLADTAGLLSKTLNVSVEQAKPLAALFERKTAGNPFFIRRLLQRLHGENLIRFDPKAAGWFWDLEAIEAAPLADNVLDLMLQAIDALPGATRTLLETASCIGHGFDLGTLAELAELQRSAAADLLWPALEDGLIVPIGATYKAARRSGPQEDDDDLGPQRVEFAHDRVQQALYSQLSPDRRAEIHLQVGRRLLAGTDPAQLDERLFDVVDQLNLGQGLVSEPKERRRLAELNLAAGTKARGSGAYEAAAGYLTVALSHLPESPWSAAPELTFSGHRQLAECAYLTGRHAEAEALVDAALKHAPDDVAKADLYGLRVLAATVAGDWDQALRWGRVGLEVFGQAWPMEGLATANEAEAARVMPNVGDRHIQDLVDEAEIADRGTRACMRLLSILGPPAYFSGSEVLTFLVTRAANLTLVHGPSAYSAYAFAFYAGLQNARTGDYTTGYEFGRLALGLARRFGDRAEESRSVEVFGLIVHPWKAPLRESLPLLREGYRAGVESGELAYAAFNLNSLLINGLPAGAPLSDLLADADATADFATLHKNRTSLDMAVPFRQLAHRLMAISLTSPTLDDDTFETARYLAETQANQTALGFFQVARLQLAYLFGDYDLARRCAEEAAGPVQAGNLGMVTTAEHVFFSALSLAADLPDNSADREDVRLRISALNDQLAVWAAGAPLNFAHRQMLVAGELARLNGDVSAALKLYRSAIENAAAQAFTQDEALGHELRARLLLLEDEPEFAAVHLRAAVDAYRRWGAVAKANALETANPVVFKTQTSTKIRDVSIDALALMKASEAIASETTTEGLVERILGVVAEAAGAQNGALMLCEGAELTLRGLVQVQDQVVVTLEDAPLDQRPDLPGSILRTALRTKEAIVLSNAVAEGAFVGDPAVKARQARSVLCVPLTSKSSVVGLIYLENLALADAFSPGLVEVVKVLATQAAISLENTTLVETLRSLAVDLENRVEELRQSDRELRFTLEAGRFGAWTLDLETKEFVTSHTCRTNFGRDPSAGFTYAELVAAIHPGDRDRQAAAVEHSVATGADYDIEYRIIKGDGSLGWVLSRAQPSYDSAGVPLKMTGVSIDVTERKVVEEELLSLNETLEQRVAERAAALDAAHEQLRQSQKMEAVGQLTGGIAHDFNNLLAGISGSLELLESRIAQGRLGETDRYIRVAQESTRRAASLTQRLLAFSRRQTLDPKVVDGNKLIAGLEDLLRRSVGPDVEIEVAQAGGLWRTRLDPSQLENAILNLCINARDAMAPSGGRITIETANKWLDDRGAKERDLPPGQYVSICVTDTGTGMPPDVIDKVFDPFFTTKPLGQGTGLGLSMVYGFVRQSGGQVRIYSEVGEGTTVCLYLPRFAGADDDEVALEDHPADLGSGETVLVIDDEPAIRMLVADVLGEAGYNVLEAEDGPTGLRLLESNGRIDLLITDVGLPGGLNGRQVADAARQTRPGLKVLFITGFAENAVIGNGHLDAGMSVITKPFVMSALANKIRELIDQPSLTKPA